jgi:two-component system, LytTR family, response regulator
MLRAIIIDDEQRGINTLKLLIQKFVVNDVKIVAETTEAEKSVTLIEDYKPEIVFLDINMPFLNGFQVLELLNYKDFHLIFTTAHEEYALKAIKNNALDYLLKPIVADHLKEAIEKIKARIVSREQLPDLEKLFSELRSTNRIRFPITHKDGTDYVFIEDIIRLEADSNYTKVFLTNGKTGLNPKTLKEYENMLCTPGSHFMRIHQSHIVNLKCVNRFLKEDHGIVVTKDNAKIPLSKHKREEFLNWLNP